MLLWAEEHFAENAGNTQTGGNMGIRGKILHDLHKERILNIYSEKNRLIPQNIYIEFKKKKKCNICGKSKKNNEYLEIDHKIPLSKGGKTTRENLQALCHECHKKKTMEEKKNGRKETI